MRSETTYRIVFGDHTDPAFVRAETPSEAIAKVPGNKKVVSVKRWEEPAEAPDDDVVEGFGLDDMG